MSGAGKVVRLASRTRREPRHRGDRHRRDEDKTHENATLRKVSICGKPGDAPCTARRRPLRLERMRSLAIALLVASALATCGPSEQGLGGRLVPAPLGSPQVAEPENPTLRPSQPGFRFPATQGIDASRYLGQGDRYNCSDFASQADAQAVLRADPTDPNRLDADRDGIACETSPSPRDSVPVPRR
jgi:hypothetical protein